MVGTVGGTGESDVAAEAMKRDVNGCPELEVIAAFLDRRLGDADREEVAGHLSTCEACYFVFSEAAQTKPAAGRIVSSSGSSFSGRA